MPAELLFAIRDPLVAEATDVQYRPAGTRDMAP